MVVKPMYTEDKPFLSLVPLVFTKPFLKKLRPLSNVVLHFSPTSRGAIAALNTSLPPDDYIASGWFSYFPLGAIAGYLVHSYLLTQAIDAPRAALVGVIIMGFVVGTFTWVNLRHAHSVMKERAQEIDKYLLYALRDFSLQLQSGATVFKALVAVANAGYNQVSEEFMHVVKRINAGISLERAVKARLEFTQSDYLKKAYWQVLNNMHSGSDLHGGLNAIILQLHSEQKTKIQNYARELNLWSLIYMLFAVAIPTIGSTMLVILSMFAKIGISEQMFILFIVACFVVQIAMTIFVRSRRPVVQF